MSSSFIDPDDVIPSAGDVDFDFDAKVDKDKNNGEEEWDENQKLLEDVHSGAETVNILSWITAFIWLIPNLGNWADIVINAVIIGFVSDINKKMQVLIEFFTDEDNYHDQEFFDETMEEREKSYEYFDEVMGTNISLVETETNKFEKNPGSDQLFYAIFFMCLAIVESIAYIGWIFEIFVTPTLKLIFLIYLVEGYGIDAVLDWMPVHNYYFE